MGLLQNWDNQPMLVHSSVRSVLNDWLFIFAVAAFNIEYFSTEGMDLNGLVGEHPMVDSDHIEVAGGTFAALVYSDIGPVFLAILCDLNDSEISHTLYHVFPVLQCNFKVLFVAPVVVIDAELMGR